MTAEARPDAAGLLSALRAILVTVTGRDEFAGLSAQAPLLGPGAGLDSLAGVLLLTEIRHRFGVDVAAEDLNLDCLASLAALTAFIVGHGADAATTGG